MPEAIGIPSQERPFRCILDVDVEEFLTELKVAGYSKSALRKKRTVARAFARWSGRRKLVIATLNESAVGKFLARSPRRRKARITYEAATLSAFLEHLGCGTGDDVRPTQHTPVFPWEERYVDFLRGERGLAENSIRVYQPHVHQLLSELAAKYSAANPQKLNVEMVRSHLLDRAQGRSSEWTRLLSVALRSFFGFLYIRGETQLNFSVCVPAVRKWSQVTVPGRFSPEEVKRALAVPDRSTPVGRRDYAILLLLARLGLRAGEIVGLELEDLHWRTGEIAICGKGQQKDTVPLPREVGQAVAQYLRRGRGSDVSRRVFLRATAPRQGLTGPAAIGHIVRRVLARAGIRRSTRGAAHLFRHTLASQMIQHGASLNEIAGVLRHRSQTTTEIYAKVDIRSLRQVARPWPTTGGVR